MNKINFLVSKLPIIDLTESITGNATFSLSINKPEDIKEIDVSNLHSPSLYLFFDFQFSVHFNLLEKDAFNELLSKELLKNKSLFFQLIFHPNFMRIGDRPVIFISLPLTDQQKAKDFMSEFEAYAIQQGYNGIHWIYYNQAGLLLYRLKEIPSFYKMYYKLLEEEYFLTEGIGILNDSSHSFSEIIQSKLSCENEFKTMHPSKHAFLEKYHQLKSTIPVLEEKLKRTTEDLINQKTYLNLLRDEDEANKINRFYYYEYEILPKWYKQLGHIIKVLIGKRNFRSLFNSNIKKYKN